VLRAVGLVLIGLFAAAVPARAQVTYPIPKVVLDARGFTVGFGEDEITAGDLVIELDELPTRGFGGVAGLNVYPFRVGPVTIGATFEALLARGRKAKTDLDGVPISTVTRRFQSLSGGVSLNFGHRDGFSYVVVGMGPVLFDTATDTRPAGPASAREMTLNFGGGARWFNTRHFAFGFDVRFYETKPENATLTSPGRERRRLLVLSAGVSIR
jgi:hypothetical protein